MSVHLIAATVHGRYLVDRPAGDSRFPMLVGFHGYGERAEDMLSALQRIRGGRPWLLVSIQALNRFYTKADAIVANWMTREDREQAIDDNINYVAAALAAVRREQPVSDVLVYAGFSQGVAMAYRAAAFAQDRADLPSAAAGIMLAGDVPPDVAPKLSAIPRLLLGRGTTDDWYTEAKMTADLDLLRKAGVATTDHVFQGGHVWHDSFVVAAGAFLERTLDLPVTSKRA